MIKIKNILEELDALLGRNDYSSALELLLRAEQDVQEDHSVLVTVYNELIGLNRKLNREADALLYSKKALELLVKIGENTVACATTQINAATAFKAFGRAEESIELFRKARKTYEEKLPENDGRLGGLYNNMALTLVDLKKFQEARELYSLALIQCDKQENGVWERAITLLNLASLVEEEKGLEFGAEEIEKLTKKAEESLNEKIDFSSGYYAFVCEKCATVFGYYGHFAFEAELNERARKIYERT